MKGVTKMAISARKVKSNVALGLASFMLFSNVVAYRGISTTANALQHPVTIENPDFEAGDLSGWMTTGNAFSDLPSSNQHFWGDHPFKQNGTYHAWGWNPEAVDPSDSSKNISDSRTGTLKSSTFRLSGNGEVNFLVGGGNVIDNLYVSLVRASDHTILFKSAGFALLDQFERYVRVNWQAQDYIGEDLYIEVVDNSTSQHINVDDFHVYNVTNSIDNPSFETGDLSGWNAEGDAFSVSNAVAYGEAQTSYYQKGKYFVSGLTGDAGSAEAKSGSLQSTSFKLEGTGEVNFLIGGTNDMDHTYVALVRESDDTELFRATGSSLGDGPESMKRVIWNASAQLGEAVYLKVVDTGQGHINVDDFHVLTSKHDIVNPDFETGDLTGWTVVSGEAPGLVSPTVKYWHENPINKTGQFHFWGDDQKLGTIKSSEFVLGGTGEIDFMMGGGNLDTQYVALMRASDNTELMRAKNTQFADSEAYARVTWDASAYLGEQVYLMLVDEVAAGGWQHVNLDDIHVYNRIHDIVNPDFETGDLTGWTITSSEAPGRVTSDVNYWHPDPVNKTGEYHFWGDDWKEGTFQSTTFILGGNGEINFMLGGGNFPQTEYVALVRASDGKELIKSTHTAHAGSEGYDRVVWDASAYLGEEVYLKAVDSVPGGGWQHFNLDDIHVFNNDPADILNPSFETGTLEGWQAVGDAFTGTVSAETTSSDDQTPINQLGTYFVQGLAGADSGSADARTGSLQSQVFKLGGNGEINFMLSGNHDPNHLYVALVNAVDDSILLSETPANGAVSPESLRRIIWDAAAYLGKKVYVKVVDNSPTGHLNVDDFHVRNTGSPSYVMNNEDFEKGDLSGWTVGGNAFSVSDQDTDSSGNAYGQQRNYHVIGNNEATGTLTSSTFRLAGTGTVNFKISGDIDVDHLYVSLVRASDHKELFRATGNNSKSYQTVSWDASKFINEELYFTIVDNVATGHLNVDDFNYYVSHEVMNGDFESGDLRGWKVVEGNAFDNTITTQDKFWGTKPFKHNGLYHLWGFQGGGDNRKGIMESSHFIALGDKNIPTSGRLTFLMGGGSDIDNLYVALVRDRTGEILYTSTGMSDEQYSEHVFDATPYAGEELYFRIVDQTTAGFGHLNLDRFVTVNAVSQLENPDFETGDLSGWTLEGETFADSVSNLPGNENYGTYYVNGNKTSNPALTGTLSSKVFQLTGTGILSFLVAGGKDANQLHVALVRASDQMELFRATGSDSDIFQDVTWDASAYLGEEVYFKVVDNKTSSAFGYINVDDFQLSIPRENYSEPYRPQLHYTPEKNWMNDPNGMVYYNGEYHLFYQYTPFSTSPAFDKMHWGHAVSTDLTHWEELPPAIAPDEHGAIFSGSAVVDAHNTSGFFNEEGSGLVAFYTQNGSQQVQSIAYSKDNGRTWTKYTENPVLLPEAAADLREPKGTSPDFRDPKVFWHEDTHKWIMQLAVGHHIEFYSSTNLKQWNYESSFGSDGLGSHFGIYECPDLIELPVDGDPTKKKWVMIISTGDGNGNRRDADPQPPGKGSGMMYFVGTFDGKTFTPDERPTPDQSNWIDYGSDFYAAVTWSNIRDEQGRPVWLGWMNNWRYASNTPTSTWRGGMSIPRTVELKTTTDGIRLIQEPVQQLEQLRKPVLHWTNFQVQQDNNVLQAVYGSTMEIVAEFGIQDASEFGFRVRKSNSQETVIGYDTSSQKVFVDRTRSGGPDVSDIVPVRQEASLLPENNKIKLHIFVDEDTLEVFANDGRRVFTDQIFPDSNSKGLELYAENGEVNVNSLSIYQLDSIWADRSIKKLQMDKRSYTLETNGTHKTVVSALVLSSMTQTVSQAVYGGAIQDASNSVTGIVYGGLQGVPLTVYGYGDLTSKQMVTDQAVFKSSDPSIAIVNAAGIVFGKRPGQTLITAAYKGHVTTASVTVLQSNETHSESTPETPVTTGAVTTPNNQGRLVVPTSVINKIAVGKVSKETLNKALEAAGIDAKGTKKITIELDKADDVKGYSIEIPSTFLSSDHANRQQFEIRNPIGTMTLSSQMFTKAGFNENDNIVLSMTLADRDAAGKGKQSEIGARPVLELIATLNGKVIPWRNADAPVQVTVNYKPVAEEMNHTDHLVVWYLDPSGGIAPVPNAKFNKATGEMIFKTIHFSYYAIAYVNKSFDDLNDYAWAKKQVELLASKGIIQGTTEAAFAPQEDITRADFILLLVRALELTAQADSNFDDVKSDDYYYEAVSIAKKLGITNGIDGSHFNPNASITRQDMIVMLNRAMAAAKRDSAKGTKSDLNVFQDSNDISPYAIDSVSSLVKSRIIEGNNGKIHPFDHTTRAETAVVLYRLLMQE
jgi:sucrose-6-phosphate hydrolase SacC (GH32 family)